MANALLHASALLALLFEETDAQRVNKALQMGATMSSANIAEVAARLHTDQWSAEEVAAMVGELRIEVFPLDREIALLSGQYRPATRSLGLSLIDRVCLATAYVQQLPVLTSDRAWAKVKLHGVTIQHLRK